MNNSGTLLIWYYHLPSVSSDSEIKDLVEMSIHPLLTIHDENQIPFTFAITGSLLVRICKFEETLLLLKKLINNNIVEIAATFFYEIYPPLIPFEYLKLHLQQDILTKKRILNTVPVSFYPPNFTWVSIMEFLLNDLGIKNVILDSEHYSLCCKTQVWKWTTQTQERLNSVLIDTVLDDQELFKIYTLGYSEHDNNQNRMSIFFRNFPVIKRLSFGNSGLFHQPYNWVKLKTYFNDLISKLRLNEYIIIADDGDRINPVSLQNYSLLLKEFSYHRFLRPLDLNFAENTFNEIPYLPSYSIGNFQSFWLSDLDCIHYINLLDQVYDLERHSQRYNLKDEIMDLQDVYFLFWKTISRKKYYIEKIYSILNDSFGNSDGYTKENNN